MLKKEHTARDIHADITQALITAIEASPGQPSLPWRKQAGALHMPVNALTANAYNGINILSLWVAAEVRGFTAPLWGTYRQWSELGAQVRKGEKSSLVVFYKEFETDPDPEDRRRIAASGMTTNAFMTAAILGRDAPHATPRRAVDVAEVTRLLAMTAMLADRLRDLSSRAERPEADAVKAALLELSEIRTAAFLALGRKP